MLSSTQYQFSDAKFHGPREDVSSTENLKQIHILQEKSNSKYCNLNKVKPINSLQQNIIFASGS